MPHHNKDIHNKQRRERRKGPDGEKVRALQMASYYRRRDRVLLENREKYKLKKPHMRVMQRKYKYGISKEEYEQMYLSQKGCCAICGKHKKLGIDHNHQTKAVRALLCTPCNTGIGLFKENPMLLLTAIEYLQGREPSWNNFVVAPLMAGV
jgi:hypothetical protein